MAELCSTVGWKVELVSDDLGYLAEDISKQNVENKAWFPLDVCSEMQEETHKGKKDLLTKK